MALRPDAHVDSSGDFNDKKNNMLTSSEHLRTMVAVLTLLFNSRKLTWNRTDLKVMTTSLAGTCSFTIDTLGDDLRPTEMKVRQVDELVVLGCKVNNKGSTWVAVDASLKKYLGNETNVWYQYFRNH